jgi:hypothetical protein
MAAKAVCQASKENRPFQQALQTSALAAMVYESMIARCCGIIELLEAVWDIE